jgi:ribosomal protein S8
MSELHTFIVISNRCIKSNSLSFSCHVTSLILQVIKLFTKHGYLVGFRFSTDDKTKIVVFLRLNFERTRSIINKCEIISTKARPICVR